jgi:hypothetical protein
VKLTPNSRQSDYSPAPIGRVAFNREIAARRPQQPDQDERKRRLLVIRTFQQMRDDGKRGERQHELESAPFALVNIDRRNDKRKTVEQYERASEVKKLQWQNFMQQP